MHIIVRYELESGLIDGSIKVKLGSLKDETLILSAASPQGGEYGFLLPANASALVSHALSTIVHCHLVRWRTCPSCGRRRCRRT